MAKTKNERYAIPAMFRMSTADKELIDDIMLKQRIFNRSDILREIYEIGLPIYLERVGMKDTRNKSNGKD